VNFYTCGAIDDDADENASSTGRCAFEAEIRHRTATNEFFITKYVGHSFGCVALSPNIDRETRAELVDDDEMQAISMQRGGDAVRSCVAYLLRRYSYVVDEAPAAALLQCVRRKSSMATRAKALERLKEREMRSKLEGELMTCIANSREVISSLRASESPTSRDLRKYYHVFGSLHTHCGRLPEFDSLASLWTAADVTSSAALIHALELGIKKFAVALRDARGDLPACDRRGADALTALRRVARSERKPLA
jgi:hypothetical protein